MSVVEVASALGEWGITLRKDTPQSVLDSLTYFGHVAISSGRVDPAEYGDLMLRSARYVGVNLVRSFGEDNKKIGGQGMAFWLGDGDDKGYTIEAPLVFPAGTAFNAAIPLILPPTVSAGTIYNQTGTYQDTVQWKSRRAALDYITSLFNSEWRVNGDATVDVGRPDQLYVTTPKAAILRNRDGLEMDYRAAKGRANLDSDVKDFTTRVLLLAEGSEATTVSATADIAPALNPYKDLKGNPVVLTRVVSEQQTSTGNASARAQLQLNRFTSPRDALKLTTKWYDIRGDISPGDYVWVFDPEAKLSNPANPIDFHGEYLTPMKLRVFQMSWPVEKGMGVAFRDYLGNWTDITDWVVFESGDTDVVVGGYNRSLTGAGSSTQDPGSRPTADSTVPAAPAFTAPFNGTYSADDGMTRAQIILNWSNPLNVDGSVITDGDRFELRFRTGEVATQPVSHADMHLYRHNQLSGSQRQPIPLTLGDWGYFTVGWGINSYLLLDLDPGIPYEFEIRAYDSAAPANVSAWSSSLSVTTQVDRVPPADPAPPTVAASKAAIQIIHQLGRASGGTFNMNMDLNHFQVHVGNRADAVTNPLPVDQGGTLLGKVSANRSMIQGQVPAVASFQVRSTDDIWVWVIGVDNDGNLSGRSSAVQSKAELWDDAYITNLSVSKLTAGFIQAQWINAGMITTALSGARVVVAWYGIEAFNQDNLKTLQIDSQTGDVVVTGTFQTGLVGRRVVVSGEDNDITFFPEVGETRSGRIFSYIPSNYPNDICIERRSIDSDQTSYISRDYLLPDRFQALLSPKGDGGDLYEKAGVFIQPEFVQISASQINGVSGSFSETARARMVLYEDGLVDAWTNNAQGDRETNFYMEPTRSGLEMRAGTERDGGFLWLGKGNTGATYFGLHTTTRDKYIRFGSTDTVIADSNVDFLSVKPNRIDIVTNGRVSAYFDDGGSVEQGIKYALRFAGLTNGSRAALQTDGGGSICFYYSGGTLNIGDQDSGAFIKTFVIPHPSPGKKDSQLVHATTESPVAGVEYTGKVAVKNGSVEVELPAYFEDLCALEDRTVHLTVIADDASEWSYPRVKASVPNRGRFKIYSDSDFVRVFWLVKAKRKDVPQFEVEPLVSTGELRRVGPYTWREEH